MKSRIDRREFLGAALTTAAGGIVTSCRPESRTEAPTPAEQPISDFELDEMTVRGLQAGMQEGRFTARRITELYLGRIEAIDKDGEGRPGLHSIIEVNEEALSVAEALDRERGSDPVLLTIAYAFEQATKFRRKPGFLASL